MTSGVNHAKASVVAPVGAAALATAFLFGPVPGLLAGVGCLAGVIISPDLDIDGITYSERIVVLKVGRIGWLWRLYWWPYGKLISHRAPISHAPVVSTAIRLAYLFVPLMLLGLRLPVVFLWFGFGLGISDVMHWLMDK